MSKSDAIFVVDSKRTDKEVGMQVELLKFLLDAHRYLRAGVGADVSGYDSAPVADLQAVVRVLPDCDWYETADEVAEARSVAGDLWNSRATLEFS